MSFTDTLQLYSTNLAVWSVFCASLSLLVGRACRGLPNEHAVYSLGMCICLVGPMLVLVGCSLSWGVIPSKFGAITRIERNPTPLALTESEAGGIEKSPAGNTYEVSLPPSQEMVGSVSVLETARSRPVKSQDTEWATHLSRSNILALSGIGLWILGTIAMTVVRCREWLLCNRLVGASDSNCPEALYRALSLSLKASDLSWEPKLQVSSHVSTPYVIGVIRPVIVVPRNIDSVLTEHQLRAVLSHEIAHIARKDHWSLLLATTTTTLYWWNPVVWLLCRRIAVIREQICDDTVLFNDACPREYAESIISLAERHAALTSLGLGLSSARELEQRIKRIVACTFRQSSTSLSRLAISLGTVYGMVLVIILSIAQFPRLSQAQQDSSSNSGGRVVPVTQARDENQESSGNAKADNAQIDWTYDLDKASLVANTRDKDVCVLFTGKGWCQPCEVMEQDVLNDAQVIELLNNQFVPVELDFTFADPESPNEKLRESRFRGWANQYAVFAYPTFVLLDAKNRPYFVSTGWVHNTEPQEFLRRLRSALKQKKSRDRYFRLAQNLSGEKKAIALHQGLESVGGNLGSIDQRRDDPVLFYYASEVSTILSTMGDSESLSAAKAAYAERKSQLKKWKQRNQLFDKLKAMQQAQQYGEAIDLLREQLTVPSISPELRSALLTQLENFLAFAKRYPELLKHYDAMLQDTSLGTQRQLTYRRKKASLLFYNMKDQEKGLQFVEEWITSAQLASQSHKDGLEIKGEFLWRNQRDSDEASATWNQLRDVTPPNTFDYLSACSYLAQCEDAAGNSGKAAQHYHEILNTLVSRKNGKNEIRWPWNSKAIPGAYLQTAEYYLRAQDVDSALELLKEVDLDAIQIENGGIQNSPQAVAELKKRRQRLLREAMKN